uniref:Endoplasmic reticulum metallopeptidase 1 n=1 Tax=Oncorhynchus tshawytscha TaxID=74940 RepID=A0AAZ3QJM0_ONCTS
MQSGTNIRRIKACLQNNVSERNYDPEDQCGTNGCSVVKKKPKVSFYMLHEGVGVALVTVFILVLWGLVHFSLQQLVFGKATGEFNAVRARKHLERITSVGPRPVGSRENEVLTVNFLLEQIEHIKTISASGPNSVTVDVQRPTGSYKFLGGITSYCKVSNIAVRLEPKAGAQHLMLANCHFDTVANSPGASDDAVSCAVMLEVLHSLANLSTPLRHGVVFLFNGAEETMQQASHGFITQHPWAKQVRAFINLEAVGVGGKELVFQTGPENPWLIQAYKHAAKHPFASVVGQEIFQRRLIPSDTDFRIYRDFGNIPGIDLAFIENGFIYHTKYDTPDRILTDSIQRAGDNILAVLKHLVMSEELADSSEYRHGNTVFFDLLGMVVVAYPAHVGTIINYITAIATFLYLFKKCFHPSNMGCCYVKELACATVAVILSWLVTLLTVIFVAFVYHLKHTFSSGNVPFLVYSGSSMPLLTPLTLCVCLFLLQGVRHLEVGELYFDVSLLLWCGALVYFTAHSLCSAYVPMLMVAFPLATKLLLAREFKLRGASVKYSVLYQLGLALPYVHFMSLIWLVFEIFTPTLGRINTYPPDVVLATIVTFTTLFFSSFFLHFIYLARSTKWLLAGLGTVFTVLLLLVSCGMFFPYTADPSGPRPKRVSIQHTTRIVHGLDGQVESRDSGLWINSCDYTGMQHITPIIPEINDTIKTNCQEDRPFCGFPWFGSDKNNWYLPAPEVFPKSPVEFQLLSKEETKWGTVRLTFEVKGPSHMSLYLMPHRGASLSSWWFGDGTPQLYLAREYFIFYTHGLDAPAWNFWFQIQEGPEGMISVAISSHYYFGEDQRTVQLDDMLQRFPKWAFPSSWVSTYHMYRY